MSIRVMTLVWDHYPEGGGELLLLLALADWAHDDGTGIWSKSIASMVKKTRQAERTIRYQLGRLRDQGWLEFERGGKGAGDTTTYRIPVSRISQELGLRVQDLHPSEKPARAKPSTAVHKGAKDAPIKGANDDTEGGNSEQTKGASDDAHLITSLKKTSKATQRCALPDGFGISERVQKWAKEKGFVPFLDAHLEYFLSYAKANNARYVDWDEALMNCIRADWGRVRKNLQSEQRGQPVARTCDFRGLPFVDATGPCGLPGASACSEYSGRFLCVHHQQKVLEAAHAPAAKSVMPASVRQTLSGLGHLKKPGASPA